MAGSGCLLYCDARDDCAYTKLGKDLTPTGDVWLRFDFFFDDKLVTNLTELRDYETGPLPGASPAFVTANNAVPVVNSALLILNGTGGVDFTFDESVGQAGDLQTDTWYTIDVRFSCVVGSHVFSGEVWVDGVQILTYAPSDPDFGNPIGNPYGQFIEAAFGLYFSGGSCTGAGPPNPGPAYFLDNCKIGTSRGGSQIYSNDFGSCDLTGWDTSLPFGGYVVTNPPDQAPASDDNAFCFQGTSFAAAGYDGNGSDAVPEIYLHAGLLFSAPYLANDADHYQAIYIGGIGQLRVTTDGADKKFQLVIGDFDSGPFGPALSADTWYDVTVHIVGFGESGSDPFGADVTIDGTNYDLGPWGSTGDGVLLFDGFYVGIDSNQTGLTKMAAKNVWVGLHDGGVEIFDGNISSGDGTPPYSWVDNGDGVVTITPASDPCGSPTDDGTGHDDDPPSVVFDKGFRWIAWQAQNDTDLKVKTIGASWKDAGFFVGVWGVTYHYLNFDRDGTALAAQANLYDADFLIIDAEECLKNVTPTQAQVLIDALADFAGPKALFTYGAACGDFVQPMPYSTFLDAGYDILPGAYYSATSTADGQSECYRPDLCIAHSARAGIDRSKQHLVIDTCSSGHPTASEWVTLLDDAGSRDDFSVFLSECTSLDDLDTLAPEIPAAPDAPFSFALPGLWTDNGGGIATGPGGPGAPGLPPDGGPLPGPGEPGYGGGSPGFDHPPGTPGPGSGSGWLGGGSGDGSLPPGGGGPGGLPSPTLGYWRSVVTDLDSRIETLLDRLATNRKVTYTLDDTCIATGDTPSDNPEVNIPALDGEAFLSYSDRLLYLFRREGTPTPWVCRYAGILMQLEDEAESDNAVTHYIAYDPWQLLMGRPVVTDAGVLPGRDGLVYEDMRGDEIALDLLVNTIAAHGPCHIDPSAFVPVPTANVAAIKFQRGMSVGEAWKKLCVMTPMDIVLKPIYDPVSRPGMCSELYISPQYGTQRNEAIFAWDKPSRSLVGISRLDDGTRLVNKLVMYDQNANPLPVVTDAVSAAKYGEYWDSIFDAGEESATSLTTAALVELALRKAGKQTLAIHPAPSRMPELFTEFYLGDTVPIYASNRLREPVLAHKRVYQIPVDIDDASRETVRDLIVAPLDES